MRCFFWKTIFSFVYFNRSHISAHVDSQFNETYSVSRASVGDTAFTKLMPSAKADYHRKYIMCLCKLFWRWKWKILVGHFFLQILMKPCVTLIHKSIFSELVFPKIIFKKPPIDFLGSWAFVNRENWQDRSKNKTKQTIILHEMCHFLGTILKCLKFATKFYHLFLVMFYYFIEKSQNLPIFAK